MAPAGALPGRGTLRLLISLLFAVGIAVASGLVVDDVHHRADNARQVEVALQEISSLANGLSAIEWQAAARRKVDADLHEQAHATLADVVRVVERLRRNPHNRDRAAGVASAATAFVSAVEADIDLVADGRLAEAELVDRNRVDPAFELLREVISDTMPGAQATAREELATARRDTFALLVGAAVLITLLSALLRRARARAGAALVDPLTGLANRRVFEEPRTPLQNAERAVVFVDLDDFKAVNDRHGHETGDLLLVEFARRLRTVARDGEIVARLGGDEFVVVCQEGGTPAAAALAARLRDVSVTPFDLAGTRIRIGATIGYAVARTAADDLPALIRCADRAMYAGKTAGKGAVVRYDPAMHNEGTAPGEGGDGGVLLRDLRGRITEVDDRLCEMTGYGRDELVGCDTPYPFWPPEEIPAIISAFEGLVGDEGTLHLTFRRRSGERFPVRVRSEPVRDDEGFVLGHRRVISDLSRAGRHAAGVPSSPVASTAAR